MAELAGDGGRLAGVRQGVAWRATTAALTRARRVKAPEAAPAPQAIKLIAQSIRAQAERAGGPFRRGRRPPSRRRGAQLGADEQSPHVQPGGLRPVGDGRDGGAEQIAQASFIEWRAPEIAGGDRDPDEDGAAVGGPAKCDW
jgi:hypothetical protein